MTAQLSIFRGDAPRSPRIEVAFDGLEAMTVPPGLSFSFSEPSPWSRDFTASEVMGRIGEGAPIFVGGMACERLREYLKDPEGLWDRCYHERAPGNLSTAKRFGGREMRTYRVGDIHFGDVI